MSITFRKVLLSSNFFELEWGSIALLEESFGPSAAFSSLLLTFIIFLLQWNYKSSLKWKRSYSDGFKLLCFWLLHFHISSKLRQMIINLKISKDFDTLTNPSFGDITCSFTAVCLLSHTSDIRRYCMYHVISFLRLVSY